ncbi:MAG: ATP-binding protein [Prolixibacteraceae bacterium]|nr:ATP-binding protein [Prolixibacteraceae bacterium]
MKEKPYIKRPLYFNRIEPYIDTGLIKVLTGQRRVGKSYILLQVMDEIHKRNPSANIIYINKEDYQFESIKDHNALMDYLSMYRKKGEKQYLFIDEVQEISNFELALRSLLSVDSWDIYITGSNATLLSGELATLLSGRTIQITIHSLLYPEFIQFHRLEDSPESLLKYIRWGGMPHLINLPKNDAIVYEYLRNIQNTIILRDIVARFNIRNVSFLQNLINYLADITGSILSAKRISDYLKSQRINLSPKLVLEYLSFLESVFLIERAKRMEVEGKKIFEVGDKFYFEDIGMRHAIIPFQQKDIGKTLENIVYHHLIAAGHAVFVGKYRDKEIDFVAVKRENKSYIQVAYLIADEKTHEREFGNLLSIPDNCPKMVISMDEQATGNYKGIEHLSIRKFLTRNYDY